MGPQPFEELHHDLQNFDDYFDHAGFFGVPIDDGGTSFAPAISIAHEVNSSGDFSLPMSTPAGDIFVQPIDETRVQGLSTHLNTNDGSEVTEGVFSHFGSSFHTSCESEISGHSFLSYMNWDTSPNHNVDQNWPAGNFHSNKDSRIADMASGLDHSRPTEFSSWIAEERSAPVNPPMDFLGREGMANGRVLNSLIEAQDVPRNVEILPSIGQNMGAFQTHEIPAPVTVSQFPVALATCLNFFGELPPNPGQVSHGPNFNANLYPNHPNTDAVGQHYLSSSNSVAICCDETSLTRMKKVVQDPQGGYGFSGRGKKRIGSSAVPKSGDSRLKNPRILPAAPAMSTPRESHHAKSSTQLQTVFGPKEALQSRSDRRKLTANGKKNAREVRGHSCIVCVMKNQRVILFLYPSPSYPR
jgi:hypothetical protein